MSDKDDDNRSPQEELSTTEGLANGDLVVGTPVCEVNCSHPDLIRHISSQLVTLDQANELAALFKTLGDPTRVRIMDALARSEMCVCDLAELIGLSQSAVSHQLRVLRSAYLVKFRREGKMVFYSLDDSHVVALYSQGLEHIAEG